MSGNQYQIAVSVLFPTYVLFELPSNLVLKHYVRPSRWIAFITTAWGLIATLSGLTQSYAGLLACRVLLGLFEAGLFPGCVVSSLFPIAAIIQCPHSMTYSSFPAGLSHILLHSKRDCITDSLPVCRRCACWWFWRPTCFRHRSYGRTPRPVRLEMVSHE